MTREELAAWLRLYFASSIGPQSARQLLSAFGLPDNIFAQPVAALAPHLSKAQIHGLQHPGADLEERIDAAWAWLQAPSNDSSGSNSSNGTMRKIVSLADADYPPALLTLSDPPLLLYITGHDEAYAQLAGKTMANDLAIVGSRNCTPQGKDNARSFAHAFAQAGLNVVSGLALGIDGAAHQGALEAAQEAGEAAGCTIAVVGTGLDRVYPKRHHDLAHRIVQRGLILSEFPIGTPPLAENFPRRNRLIAALTQGTLVVEASVQSGSLITARLALELGKEVFAIPGSIHNPQSRGCHHLIKQGAKLVESAQDVLEELPIKASLNTIKIIATNADSMPANSLNRSQNALLEALGHDPVDLDSLIARTGIDAATLQAQLLELELLGEVARLPGGWFQRQMLA
jgi:DNA processing protein